MHNERCDTGMCVVRFLSCAEPPMVNSSNSGTPPNPTPSHPRALPPFTHRSRPSSSNTGNGEGNVQTQVVQIVTPIFQGHTTRNNLSTPPPSLYPLVGTSYHIRTQQPPHQLPESTGAPPVPGQRVMPMREEHTITAGCHLTSSVDVGGGHAEADDATDEGAEVEEEEEGEDDEEPSERNVLLRTDLLSEGIESLIG